MSLTCDEVRELVATYVLGALEPAEEAAVREHLATCHEDHSEYAEAGGLVPYLLDEPEPIAPRPELRNRVMASFAAETAAARGGTAEAGAAVATAPAAPVGVQARAPEPGAAERPPAVASRSPFRFPRLRWVLAAAAVVAIVALAAGNLFLAAQLQASHDYADRLNQALALAGQPGSKVAVMGPATAGETGPGGLAVIPASGSGIIVMHDLAPTQGSQVYETWLVEGTNARPVGSFTVGSDGRGWLEGIDVSNTTGASLVVGLTREPGPGATKPTLPMVAAGNANPVPAQ